MTFPFFISKNNWQQGLTNVQTNFLEAIFNGLYTTLVQMLEKRLQITDEISDSILPIHKQLFIFPTIFGILLLLTFSLFSIFIENKSQKIS